MRKASHHDKEMIDDLIELWHGMPEDGVALHEFLGMTWDEYKNWMEKGLLPPTWRGRNGKET